MRKTAPFCLLAFSLWLLAFPKNTFAQSEACDSSVYPSIYLSGETNDHVITVTNTGEIDIKWIQIISPDSAIYMNSANANGFTSDYSAGDYVNLNGGTLGVGASIDISINSSFENIAGNLTWGVNASLNEDGSSYFNCGSPLISQGSAPVVTENSITNVSIQAGVNSASVRYNTTLSSTSVFEYGKTVDYGSNSVVGTESLSHNISISDLSASTLYHYRISVVSSEGTIMTGDNTFTTAAPGATTTITSTVTNTVTTTVTNTVTNTNTVTQMLRDTTPPSVRFLDEFEKIYEESPLVNIKVTDGSGVARIEYTIDGTNYLPIDIDDSFGNKTITTNFIPDITEDGDYILIVRATDTSNNKVSSKKVEFTIDRLPPRVGPFTVMAGPIIVNAKEFLVGVEYKFIISSAGGPNKISMKCDENVYDFVKNNDIGVWSTKIKFLKSGKCIPEIKAVDGAGNTQTVKNEELIVNNLGQLKNSTITAYWYDDYEKKFVKWDAEPYGQINPAITQHSGGYSFLLPKGKYYLEVKAVGKRTAVSNIIETNETAFVNDNWELEPSWKFWQVKKEKIITPKILGSNTFKDTNFALPKAILGRLSTLDIRGKNSVVSLLSSWHPVTNDYLKVMDELHKSKHSVYPILLQEKESQANAVKRRGVYNLNIYADPDGEIIKDQNISGLPTTWIVNRFGQVVKTKVGEVSLEEVVDLISNTD